MAARKSDDVPIRSFLASEFSPADAKHALFHIVPVPLEKSVSYGSGTAKGPAAILAASDQLEVYDGAGFPGEEGLFTLGPVNCSGRIEQVLARIRKIVAESIPNPDGRRKAIPVVLGGEHSLSYAAVGAVVDAHPGKKVGVVQFDAHADLRDEYEGSRWSHACVMRRIHADLKLPVFQVGVRALSPEEIFYRRDFDIPFIDGRQCAEQQVSSLDLPADFPENLYLTIDVDGLDPSIMPATGTPVPGGLGWYQLLGIVESLAAKRRILGFDIVEFAPIRRLHAWDFLAADLCHKVMGIIARSPLSNLPPGATW